MFLLRLGMIPLTLMMVRSYCGTFPVIQVYETRPGDSHPVQLSDSGHPDVYYGLAGSSYTFYVTHYGYPNDTSMEYKWITDDWNDAWLPLPADGEVTLETAADDTCAWFTVTGPEAGYRQIQIVLSPADELNPEADALRP